MNELINWMNSNEGVSGWAQAIGTFIALLIAIAVPFCEYRRSAKAAKKDSQRKLLDVVEKLFAMCSFAHQSLVRIHSLTGRDSIAETLEAFDEGFSRQSLKALVNGMNEFPFHDLPNAAFITIGLTAREASNLGAESVERFYSGLLARNSMEVGYAASNISHAIATLSDQLSLLHELREELATKPKHRT